MRKGDLPLPGWGETSQSQTIQKRSKDCSRTITNSNGDEGEEAPTGIKASLDELITNVGLKLEKELACSLYFNNMQCIISHVSAFES